MKLSWFFSAALVTALASPGQAQWLDNFDSYSSGGLAAQSQWTLGSNGSEDANVGTAMPFTPGNSLLMDTKDNVVYDFGNNGPLPNQGSWVFTLKVYIPSNSNGLLQCMLYNDLANNNQSTWVSWDTATGVMRNEGDKGGTLNFAFDEWNSLVVCIDLKNDVQHIYFGEQTLVTGASWTDGKSGGGVSEVAGMELWGANLSSSYVDDARLDNAFGGCISLTTSPNPAPGGAAFTVDVNSPNLGNNDAGALYLWSFNGSLNLLPILYFFTNLGGGYTLNTTVPPGLSGIEAGLKALGVTSGRPVLLSNEELIVFQ